MDRRTITLPFPRTVALAEPHPGTGSRSALTIDDLDVEVVSVSRPGPAAVEMSDGRRTGLRHVVGGRSYSGFLDAVGLTPEDAARRSAVLIADTAHSHPSGRLHDAARLEGLAATDDGRAGTEAARAAASRDIVLVDGLVMRAAKVPRVEIRIGELGRLIVDVPLMRADGSYVHPAKTPPPAWMAFPLDRKADALAMAAALGRMLPGLSPDLDWRKGFPDGVFEGRFRTWDVTDAEAFGDLAHGDGGEGTPSERRAAMGRDLVAVLAPYVGHLAVPVVRAFADLRATLDAGNDPGTLVADIADTLAEGGIPEGPDPAGALRVRVSAAALGLRLSEYEPDASPGPGPR
jgi:hypothetical protein